MLGSVVGILIGGGAADQRLDWGWPVLRSSAFCFFIGVALILITRYLFVCVLEGTVLLYSDNAEMLKKNKIFWKSDLESVVMFNSSDIHGEITMELVYMIGAIWKKVNYSVKYDLGIGDIPLQAFISKFDWEIRSYPWSWGDEVRDFVFNSLCDFQETNHNKLIEGNFFNPIKQQRDFGTIVEGALAPQLKKVGLRITEIRFSL